MQAVIVFTPFTIATGLAAILLIAGLGALAVFLLWHPKR
jgi:hypothetical protein